MQYKGFASEREAFTSAAYKAHGGQYQIPIEGIDMRRVRAILQTGLTLRSCPCLLSSMLTATLLQMTQLLIK